MGAWFEAAQISGQGDGGGKQAGGQLQVSEGHDKQQQLKLLAALLAWSARSCATCALFSSALPCSAACLPARSPARRTADIQRVHPWARHQPAAVWRRAVRDLSCQSSMRVYRPQHQPTPPAFTFDIARHTHLPCLLPSAHIRVPVQGPLLPAHLLFQPVADGCDQQGADQRRVWAPAGHQPPGAIQHAARQPAGRRRQLRRLA